MRHLGQSEASLLQVVDAVPETGMHQRDIIVLRHVQAAEARVCHGKIAAAYLVDGDLPPGQSRGRGYEA